MKNLPKILSFCGLVALLITTSGCVQDQYRREVRSVQRSPYVGSPEWLNWVDLKVDTRYANGVFPPPGSHEWYAIVDHVVFSNHSRDYYYDVYRNEYAQDYRRHYASNNVTTTRRHNYADNYYGPARFASRSGSYDYGSSYKLGSLEWRRAVTAVILSGRVPAPPPRSDPWDTPLAPSSDR